MLSSGEGNGNPLQYSCLENPLDRGAWWATAHGIPKSWTERLHFQIAGREHSSTHQQKIVLKIYWACPCPSEQHPVSTSVSLSNQEASISLLSFSIKGQNENHIHRKLTNLITWATALSNSMKLWAMLCRATQDDPRVMVESSDKM